MGAKRVKFENINKTFLTGDNRRVQAVADLNLDIKAGEFVCLLGPSGCGKTTILRMLAGFEVPTEGHIYIGDENVERITPDKRDTAMVFQNYALFPHMNVYDNIAYGLKLQKLPKSEVDERVHRILKMMNMEDFAERVPSQMSGGQQQRLCIARAISVSPEILLMDEPTSALDPISTAKIEELIRQLEKQYSIIIVTHNMQQASRISEYTGFFYQGVLEEFDKTEIIFTAPNNKKTEDYITGKFG